MRTAAFTCASLVPRREPPDDLFDPPGVLPTGGEPGSEPGVGSPGRFAIRPSIAALAKPSTIISCSSVRVARTRNRGGCTGRFACEGIEGLLHQRICGQKPAQDPSARRPADLGLSESFIGMPNVEMGMPAANCRYLIMSEPFNGQRAADGAHEEH